MNRKVTDQQVKKIMDNCAGKRKAIIVRLLVHSYKISDRHARRLVSNVRKSIE